MSKLLVKEPKLSMKAPIIITPNDKPDDSIKENRYITGNLVKI